MTSERRKRVAANLLLSCLEDDEDDDDEETEEGQEAPRRKLWISSSIKNFGTASMYERSYMDWRVNDPEKFRRYLRMTVECFDELLQKIHFRIEKMDTVLRLAIRPDKRLAITLRYLASGNLREIN